MDLAKLYMEAHTHSDDYAGVTILRHVDTLKEIVDRFAIKSVLDYGCGKAFAWRERGLAGQLGLDMANVSLYDPYVAGLDTKPTGKYDLVVSTDVAEHIPADQLLGYIDDLYARADKCLFLSIATFPSSQRLPDGSDPHVTIRPPWWWSNMLARVNDNNTPTIVRYW